MAVWAVCITGSRAYDVRFAQRTSEYRMSDRCAGPRYPACAQCPSWRLVPDGYWSNEFGF